MRKRMIRGMMTLTAVLAVMTACGQETAIERQRGQKAPTEAEVKENTPEVSQGNENTAAEENDDAVTENEDMDAPDTEDAENAALIEDGDRTSLGDIDGDGTEDFIVSRSVEDGDTYEFTWDLVFDAKIIYHGSHELPCDFGDCWYMDLDEDGEKEIFDVIGTDAMRLTVMSINFLHYSTFSLLLQVFYSIFPYFQCGNLSITSHKRKGSHYVSPEG